MTQEFRNRSGWQATAEAAQGNWNAALLENGKQYLRMASQPTADTNAGFDAVDLGGPGPDGWVRAANTSTNVWLAPADGFYPIAGSIVQINTNPAAVFCTVNEPCPTSQTATLQRLIIHELGHSLGLNHPVAGPDSGNVMECSTSLGSSASIDSDARNGGLYLYSDHPTDFGSPDGGPAC